MAAVTDDDGTQVNIRNFCFGPTILRVPEGETVTWVNRDDFAHVVLGANAAWGGYGKVRGGGEVSYRFVTSGVYPYVCTYHPGMIGAVVVGNGKPDGGAYTVTTNAGPVDPGGVIAGRDAAAGGAGRGDPDIVGAGRMGASACSSWSRPRSWPPRRRRVQGTVTH